MKTDIVISIARDFSPLPGLRYERQAPNSGEKFRDTVLKAAFQRAVAEGVRLIVELDGTEGYSTSFLEESFGGLAREEGIEPVSHTIVVKSIREPRLIEEISGYVHDANLPKNERHAKRSLSA